MKTLREICAAMILSLSLAGSVLAGQIETTGAVAPTTPPPIVTIIVTVLGAIY